VCVLRALLSVSRALLCICRALSSVGMTRLGALAATMRLAGETVRCGVL